MYSCEVRRDTSMKDKLDLDYLERREGSTRPKGPPSPPEASPDSLDLVKVVILGAPSVGKTSIIQQFVWNDFTDEYLPTDRKHTFYPSVIINDHLYEVKISDIPVIPYFPVNSYYEWTDFRFYGLRNATAYILVFDLSNVETFQYVKTIRDQIFESRDMRNVPLLVVGNKQDLICNSNANTVGSSGSGSTGALQQLALPSTSGSSSVCAHSADNRDKKRDIVNLVKKHWKCGYVECSAKYNWRVVSVFKELMKTIDAMEHANKDREASTPMMDNIHEAFEGNRCVIF
ncbi:ras-like protein family member 10B [Arctopsyche grandis]|uniref:ras-like protein family member 10B n=1 Tax=Arctopsyche grandis TaxID=121162 RepID=UPI00406D8673